MESYPNCLHGSYIGILYHHQSHLLKILSIPRGVSVAEKDPRTEMFYNMNLLDAYYIHAHAVTKTFQIMYIMSFQPCYDMN